MKTNDELVQELLERLKKLNYIHTRDIPNIELYMDQVTTFMDQHLSGGKRHDEDKVLTKTMINNYAKNDLLPPPVKKKYSRDHLILLAFIYYFKGFLSIGDIQVLLAPLSEKYFTEDHDKLDHIYNEIVKIEKLQLLELCKEVESREELSKRAFKNAPEDEREYLQLFSFVCMLSFDVYLKKQMIEQIIDEMREEKKEKAPEKDKK
ncbi:DUF1836 domain-containing protein [Fusibacillus kribbianus]|uniref:DUF1836 domain-containing protein n=1 Tax=Fusibacillus kribbianus TaxID=3044208 RepID=A0AAP4EZX1_9FIRM|nr:DUF1836 domain-containing protein [Ruminococcus sp. YH-rum2234]MDI9240928.1 DUF1836 domain-containing protein [Ruminococcus sp. YH-rum2234]